MNRFRVFFKFSDSHTRSANRQFDDRLAGMQPFNVISCHREKEQMRLAFVSAPRHRRTCLCNFDLSCRQHFGQRHRYRCLSVPVRAPVNDARVFPFRAFVIRVLRLAHLNMSFSGSSEQIGLACFL